MSERDPNLTDFNSPEFYKTGIGPHVDLGEKSVEEAPKGVQKAHKNIRTVARVVQSEVRRDRRKFRIWRIILVGAVTPIWTVIGKLLYTILLHWLKK